MKPTQNPAPRPAPAVPVSVPQPAVKTQSVSKQTGSSTSEKKVQGRYLIKRLKNELERNSAKRAFARKRKTQDTWFTKKEVSELTNNVSLFLNVFDEALELQEAEEQKQQKNGASPF